MTYTLDVDLGFGSDKRPDDASVYLMVGNTIVEVSNATGVLRPVADSRCRARGNWYDFETSYTATAADAGDPIELLLSEPEQRRPGFSLLRQCSVHGLNVR